MDALEAGSKSTTEPRKRKRSAKDGSMPDLPPPPPINIKPELPETPPAPAAMANRETSPTPMKPMFNVNVYFKKIDSRDSYNNLSF